MSSLLLDEIKWGGSSSSASSSASSSSSSSCNTTDIDTDSIPFAIPINDTINNKMHLFCGDCWKLPADAIVVGNYEVHHHHHY